MINKDYILRLAEQFGRALSIILGLRQFNKHEEALIYIDELFLQATGLTSGLINTASEEMLLHLLSPTGVLNVEKCLWVALLLKAEGDIYLELGKPEESYHRHLKSLNLFLEVLLQHYELDLDLMIATEELLRNLEEYELPFKTTGKLFRYYEQSGRYARAEDTLFEMVEAQGEGTAASVDVIEQGLAFYHRLLKKSNADLQAGNLTRQEVEEGLAELQERAGQE